ncbi:MAG: leucyl/phenylalanyl-tRNA--protein transferase [Actinobacteria bacterium]|nr:leucyl/phenylalanyl-tRNA--protein transferase [Actinomycetota bacterium]
MPLAPPPRPVPPPAWRFPDPRTADQDGVVGVGADLEPSTLVYAYRHGIFPWPHPGMPLPWFSPDPRGVLTPGTLHVSRSTRRTLRRSGWTTTVDRAFRDVVRACATPRDEDADTWITDEMARAYGVLHDLGWAHSVEVWDGAELVGGLYGVQVGGAFTGESMFHSRDDASKVALIELVRRFTATGGTFVDVQLTTRHLSSMGARDVPRARFLTMLERVGDHDIRLSLAEEPIDRLVDHR